MNPMNGLKVFVSIVITKKKSPGFEHHYPTYKLFRHFDIMEGKGIFLFFSRKNVEMGEGAMKYMQYLASYKKLFY